MLKKLSVHFHFFYCKINYIIMRFITHCYFFKIYFFIVIIFFSKYLLAEKNHQCIRN